MSGPSRAVRISAWVLAVVVGPEALGSPRQERDRIRKTLDEVRVVLSHGTESRRIQAVKRLSGLLHPTVKVFLFQVLRADPSVHVRTAALMVLVPRMKGRDIPALAGILRRELDPGLRRLIAALASRLRRDAVRTRPSPGSGLPDPGKKTRKTGKRSEGPAPFFSLNAGMLQQPYPIPLGSFFLELGVRFRRFEVALNVAEPSVPIPSVAVGVRGSAYSVFRPGFRLRHGLGVDFFLPVFLPWGAMVKFYLCEMSIRLSDVTWFEISAFGMNTGLLAEGWRPSVGFSLSLGLRFGR